MSYPKLGWVSEGRTDFIKEAPLGLQNVVAAFGKLVLAIIGDN